MIQNKIIQKNRDKICGNCDKLLKIHTDKELQFCLYEITRKNQEVRSC